MRKYLQSWLDDSLYRRTQTASCTAVGIPAELVVEMVPDRLSERWLHRWSQRNEGAMRARRTGVTFAAHLPSSSTEPCVLDRAKL